MCFQRSSEGIEGKSRPPQSGWKIAPQSRTGCRETPVAKFVVCSWHDTRIHIYKVNIIYAQVTNFNKWSVFFWPTR